MKKNKIFGAIHAFMFCAFFFSFIFRTENYLLRDLPGDYCSLFAAYLNAETCAFAAGAAFFLWFALTWNLRMHYRLFLILLLTLGCFTAWWEFGLVFVAYILAVAALCTAFPFAVNYERFEPARLFWGFLAVAPAVCFPDFDGWIGLVALVVVLVQGEIPGIRFLGRLVLAFMMLAVCIFGSFATDKKNIVPDVSANQFRQNYELMMLAYAQYGTIPDKTVSYFNHPWRSMNDLSAIVTKLSVDKNENMNAYFAGDQLRYSAEHDLNLQGKQIPVPAKQNLLARPSVVLISFPATGDYSAVTSDGNTLYYGDAWRNYSFYTVEGLARQKKKMKKNGILALQLPDDHENAIPILAAMKKVFKHTVILRWSGIYVFASDRKLTADPEVLDRNAVNSGIYRYMYAPYRIILFALTSFLDEAEDQRLDRAASGAVPRSLRDLPLLTTQGQPHVALLESLFRSILDYAVWILPALFLLYVFCRYWYAGVPGAKLPFQSFETGLIAGVTFLIPALSFSLSRHIPLLKVIGGTTITLCSYGAMIMLLFVRGKTASSFPVRILMAILCACAFFMTDISKTLLCCISLLCGIAAVCSGQCPHRCRMSSWFLGMSTACLLTPLLWYSSALYPAGCIILCYILFAGYKQQMR